MLILSIYKLVKAFTRKLKEDYINAFSAQAAYFIFLSFFPFTMFMLTLIQYLPIRQSTVLEICTNIFPTAINSYIITIVEELFRKASSGTLLSVTVIAALWSASKGFLAIVRGMNSVYNIKESRNYVIIRLWSAFYTLIFAILIIVLLVTTVFGNQLYLWIVKKFPILTDFALLVISLRAIVGLCVLVLFFLAIFIVIPNRKSKILAELPGALITAAGWLGFSYLFSFYIDNMSNYSYTYGSLTAIVLCMIWLYSCMYLMFIGAEVNSILCNPTVHSAIKNLFSSKAKKI